MLKIGLTPDPACEGGVLECGDAKDSEEEYEENTTVDEISSFFDKTITVNNFLVDCSLCLLGQS